MEEDRNKQDIFMTYDFPSYLSSDCLTFGLKSLNSFYFCYKLFYFRKKNIIQHIHAKTIYHTQVYVQLYKLVIQ